MNDTQTDFFSVAQSSGPELASFSELCNALYERELHSLAHSSSHQPAVLQRKLAGLPYHIKNVAYYLCLHQAPLNVDTHNASFQHKQTLKSPSRISNTSTTPNKNIDWFQRHAKPGLVVPIHVEELDNHHIELDSIDRVDQQQSLLHTNKHGWFSFSGTRAHPNASNIVGKNVSAINKSMISEQTRLVKPSKTVMQAACCGHRWNHKTRSLPRALTLRELLLSAQIDWKRFTLSSPRIST